MNLKSFKKIFNRFSLSHGYRASHTLNSFSTNLEYLPLKKDKSGNFMNEIIYSNINLVEQFNPLVKIDFVLKNSLQLSAEIRKDRALSLSLDNNLLTETTGNEFVLGTGYRFKKVKFKTNIGGRTTNLNGDINIKADLTMRNNITYVRNLDLLNNQVTAGQKLWSLKMSADYDLSRNFTALFFYDHTFSKFEISTSFPQTNIRSGLTLRYNFGNWIKFVLHLINFFMNVPQNLKYTRDHEWVEISGNKATVGITDFAQSELGDIVFLEVETVGEQLNQEDVFGTVEAVKTVSDLFLPLTSEIIEFNEDLEQNPELVNEDPYGKGWIIKIIFNNQSEIDGLLSSDEYKKLITW